MTAPIRTCAEHGPFAADGCPACGAAGEPLLSGERRRRLSKFLSGALRHFPGDAGLELDDRGWTDYDDLVAAAERQYGWATERHVAAVIATDPNRRFERTGTDGAGDDRDRVRAAYGHSVDVDLECEATRETGPSDGSVPDVLYHGTAPENVASIREEGLRPMSRQQVHLSGSREEARRVGARHAGDPVVLVVDAAAMLADGHRIAKRGRETYTTDRVPPEYVDGSDADR